MQPGRKRRLAAEGADLAEELQERFLHQVFRVRRVTHHAQAQGVDAAAVEFVQKLKRRSVSGLSQTDGFRLSQRYRLAGEEGVTLGSLGRFRANGPITAHPTVRMHRIPPGVVFAM